MCTVTIAPLSDGAPRVAHDPRTARIRLACNRDELRSRPAALFPVIRQFGTCRAILPVDPVSDGTWIAVNDAGLAATLLNVNLNRSASDPGGRRGLSRGTLVPRVMACTSLAQAERAITALDPGEYPPFRLVIIDTENIAHFHSDGTAMTHERELIADTPRLFTSSGLGDALVERPRRELFERLFARDADWAARQEAFHRHAWPDRKHLSICMERPEARTVSHTLIEMDSEHVMLTYTPDAPGRAQPLVPVTLARRRLDI